MKELLQLGSWERFPAMPRGVLVSSCGRPVCSVAKWIPHSIVLASGVDCVCGPLTNEEVGRGPSSSGPVASRPPLGIGSASAAWQVLLITWAFPCVGLPCMVGLLAALLEV